MSSVRGIRDGKPRPGDVAAYATADVAQSVWQILTSIPPFIGCWYLAWRCLSVSYWLTLALSVLAAGFLCRTFIIQHDCGHGSFFRNRAANQAVGVLCSLFTATPYHRWRHSHNVHHATVGNLSERGMGDVVTITVAEYRARSWFGRLCYRFYRHPLVLFGFGPTVLFLISHRIPVSQERRSRLALWSIHGTTAALVAASAILGWVCGWTSFLLVHAPIMVIFATVAVWMFYVQHQFEDTYWAHKEDWDFADAALHGSSYYRLPKLLQWFTGNIGFHHVHHFNPRIPNYRLERCHQENPSLQVAPILTLFDSLTLGRLALWDEERAKLVGFGDLRQAA